MQVFEASWKDDPLTEWAMADSETQAFEVLSKHSQTYSAIEYKNYTQISIVDKRRSLHGENKSRTRVWEYLKNNTGPHYIGNSEDF